jgi:hypothetical protein
MSPNSASCSGLVPVSAIDDQLGHVNLAALFA